VLVISLVNQWHACIWMLPFGDAVEVFDFMKHSLASKAMAAEMQLSARVFHWLIPDCRNITEIDLVITFDGLTHQKHLTVVIPTRHSNISIMHHKSRMTSPNHMEANAIRRREGFKHGGEGRRKCRNSDDLIYDHLPFQHHFLPSLRYLKFGAEDTSIIAVQMLCKD
jgi:hypothetical protein